MEIMILVIIGCVIVGVIMIPIAIKRQKEMTEKMTGMQDEIAQLEGKQLSGQILTEQEGVRLAQLKNEVQNMKDAQRNAAIYNAAQNAANQINMNNNSRDIMNRHW